MTAPLARLLLNPRLSPMSRLNSSTSRPGSVSRRVLSILGGIVLFLVLLAVLAVWSLGRFAPRLIDSTLASKSGAHFVVEANQTNLFAGRLLFEDFAVTNPSRWTDPNFIKGKRLTLDLDPVSFVGAGRRVIHLVELDIEELTLVGHADYLKDNNAQDILRGLKTPTDPTVVDKPGPTDPTVVDKPVPAEPTEGFIIEKLRLRVGRIKILAADGTPERRVVADRLVDFVFEARNITNTNFEQTLTGPLGSQVMTQGPVAGAGLLIDLTKDKVRQSITEKLLNEK